MSELRSALKVRHPLGVVAIEPLGRSMPLYDITTDTGDFIANGVVSHNCYARPTHEYLGFSAGLDFETRIMVKERAAELLREALSARSWKPQVLAMSGVTDPYQPAERRLGITRKCLQVLAEFRNPVAIVTKSHLVTRDIDLLSELAARGASCVNVSVTTLDAHLAGKLEPRASRPERRLSAIAEVARAGIPVRVLVAPVIPGLNDREIPAILEAAAKAGATAASYILLRLPHGLKDLFEDWLDRHAPLAKERVWSRIRQVRDGRLSDPRFGTRMRGEGVLAEQIAKLFEVSARKLELDREPPELSTASFRVPTAQRSLFEPA